MVCPNSCIGPCPTSAASHSSPITSPPWPSRSTGGVVGSIVPLGNWAVSCSPVMACVPMAPAPSGLAMHPCIGTYPAASICSGVSSSNCWRSWAYSGGGSTGPEAAVWAVAAPATNASKTPAATNSSIVPLLRDGANARPPFPGRQGKRGGPAAVTDRYEQSRGRGERQGSRAGFRESGTPDHPMKVGAPASSGPRHAKGSRHFPQEALDRFVDPFGMRYRAHVPQTLELHKGHPRQDLAQPPGDVPRRSRGLRAGQKQGRNVDRGEGRQRRGLVEGGVPLRPHLAHAVRQGRASRFRHTREAIGTEPVIDEPLRRALQIAEGYRAYCVVPNGQDLARGRPVRVVGHEHTEQDRLVEDEEPQPPGVLQRGLGRYRLTVGVPDEEEGVAGGAEGGLRQGDLVVQVHPAVLRPRRALPVAVKVDRDNAKPVGQPIHQRPPLARGARARVYADHPLPRARFAEVCYRVGHEPFHRHLLLPPAHDDPLGGSFSTLRPYPPIGTGARLRGGSSEGS